MIQIQFNVHLHSPGLLPLRPVGEDVGQAAPVEPPPGNLGQAVDREAEAAHPPEGREIKYSTVQYSIVQYIEVQYSAVQYSTVQ